MDTQYIERRPEGFYITNSRVPLDCIVRDYWNGEQPESIRQHFPTLTLEQVFGAIAFYLGNREDVERSFREREAAEDAVAAAHPVPEEILKRLAQARQLTHGD